MKSRFLVIIFLSYRAFSFLCSMYPVIGIFGASNNPLEFLSVIFLLILGVGSRIMMGFSPTIWVSGSRTYYFTYVLIMMSGVYLISQLPENNQSRTFKVLFGYFLVLALLLIMMYTKIL